VPVSGDAYYIKGVPGLGPYYDAGPIYPIAVPIYPAYRIESIGGTISRRRKPPVPEFKDPRAPETEAGRKVSLSTMDSSCPVLSTIE
jgi:hypothetical protein